MANEITVTTGLALSNSLLVIPSTVKTVQFTQTTARGGNPGTVDVGTVEETISFGDCVPGFVEAVNLDATNFVRLRFATGANAIRLRANGGRCLFEIDSSVTLFAIADTATCKVRFTSVNT